MTATDQLTSPFAAGDLAQVGTALDGLNISADRVAMSLTGAFASAITSGKSFEQTVQNIGLSLSKMVVSSAMQPVTQGLSSMLSSAFSGITGGGNTIAVQPFADGGIVSRPTFFGSGGGLGLMGERGAEAIVPLSRGPDGRLGLAASGNQSRAAQVTVQISTPDAESFRNSQVQISGALARAVARGQRGL
jgi:phage-related minor tail protein